MALSGRVAAWVMVLLLIAPVSASAPGTERVALAAEVVELLWPISDEAAETEVAAEIIEGMIGLSGIPYDFPRSLDGQQIESSFDVAASGVAKRTHAGLVDTLAQSMSDEQLRATLAFYRSQEGVAALRSRATATPEYEPSAAERDFQASPAGRALVAASEIATAELMQQCVELAAADYCTRVACSAHERAFFTRASLFVNPRQVRAEHTMWGFVVADLFPDPAVAALARASCAGDADGVATAVQNGADPNALGGEALRRPGRKRTILTPLVWAIDCQNAAGVEALLVARANPNQVERFGATPVTVAAGSRDPAILDLLLRSGGDPNAQEDDHTALEIAFSNADFLERHGGVPPEQAWANWDTLLAAGADPNRVAPGGQPLAHQLARYDRWEKVEWLLNRGWDGDFIYLGAILEDVEGLPREGLRELPQGEWDALRRVRAHLVSRGVRFQSAL